MSARLSHTILFMLILCVFSTSVASEGYKVPFDEEEMYAHLDRYEKRRYEGLRYLMNNHQKMQYLKIPTRKERDEWILRFWKMNDPTPATKINERKIEHEQRVMDARLEYSKKGFPGWDHRGETLIRFGKPDFIVDVAGDIGWSSRRALKMPGEVWHYYKLGMVVPFEDVNLNGECIYFMEIQTNHTVYPHEMLTDFYGLVRESSDYSGGNAYSLTFAATDEMLKFYSLIENNRHFHTADIERTPLPCYFDITTFKGGSGKLRTEVNIEIPAGELSYEEGPDGYKTDFAMKVAVYDMDMETVVSHVDMVDIDLSELPGPDASWLLPAQFILNLDPGYYRFGLEVEDNRSKKHNAFIASRNITLVGDTLSLSDIQFASSIETADSQTSFVKGPLRVIPHPLHAYRKPDPIKFYFEIYGLDLDAEDFAFWEIEYSVEAKEKKREGPVYRDAGTLMSSMFNASGFGSTQNERLEIRSEELWEGSFRLRVRVMDRRTRKSVETQTSFSILE